MWRIFWIQTQCARSGWHASVSRRWNRWSKCECCRAQWCERPAVTCFTLVTVLCPQAGTGMQGYLLKSASHHPPRVVHSTCITFMRSCQRSHRNWSALSMISRRFFESAKGGALSVISRGTMWITHKRRALRHVVDRYRAYIAHLTTLAENKTLRGENWACLKGYFQVQGSDWLCCVLNLWSQAPFSAWQCKGMLTSFSSLRIL